MTSNELAQQSTGLSLKDRLSLKKTSTTLLLDVSGSMISECEPGHSRIQALRDIVAGISNVGQIYAFNDSFQPCLKDAIPCPCGGTYMSNAFNKLKQLGVANIILITDGEAQDKDSALEAAKGMKIQIMYVGPGECPEFLHELANVAGSICTKEDITMPKELTTKIMLLLNAGKGDTTICL